MLPPLCAAAFLNPDLPVASPLCHAVLKTLQRWEQVLQKRLELFGGPPSKYISTHLQDEITTPGPALLRHKALFEPSNTPFRYQCLFRLKIKKLVCLFFFLKEEKWHSIDTFKEPLKCPQKQIVPLNGQQLLSLCCL